MRHHLSALTLAGAVLVFGAAASLAAAAPALRVHAVRLLGPPVALALAYGRLWAVSETADGKVVVVRIDASGRPRPRIIATIGAPGPDLGGIAAANGYLWAAAGTHLARVAATSPYATRRTRLPGEASAVAVGDGWVWVTTIGPSGDLLLRIDPRTLRATRRIRLASPVSRLAFGLGALWEIDARGLSRIDTRTGRASPIGLVGAPATGIALASGRVWLLAGGAVAVLTRDGREQDSFPLPVSGGSLAVADGIAWATDDCGCRRGTLVAYDLRHHRTLAHIRTGTTPDALVASARMTWVGNYGCSCLTVVRLP